MEESTIFEYGHSEEDFGPSSGMSEVEKIELLIKEYAPILKITDMDIARSMRGKYFFFRYSERYKSYDTYVEFETADELIQLVISELCLDMNFLIDKRYVSPERLHTELGDFIGRQLDYESAIKELAQNLGILAEYSTQTT